MRKGQTIGQVFTFVLASLVFVLILSFGYRSIDILRDRTDAVVLVDIENTIRQAVESIKLDYGSEKQLLLKIPSKYKEICFITDPINSNIAAYKPLIAEAAKGASQNIFLVPLATKPMSVDGIEVDGGCHCSKTVNGAAILRLTSLGNRVQIADWNEGVRCS